MSDDVRMMCRDILRVPATTAPETAIIKAPSIVRIVIGSPNIPPKITAESGMMK